jgi:signal transduction histidine kinase
MDGRARREADQLRALLEITRALIAETSLDRLLALIVERGSELLGAERSSLYLVDADRGEIWTKIAQLTEIPEIRLSLDGPGLAAYVARTGETINLADAYDDPRFSPDVDRMTGWRTRSMLIGPMRNHRGEVIGVLQAMNKWDGTFGPDDAALLDALAASASVAVENAQLIADQQAAAERRVLDEQVHQARMLEAVAKLAGGIAHDFNNILTVVNGYAQLLQVQLPRGSVQQAAVENILQAGESAASLTRQLLAFSRQQVAQPREVNLNELVEQVARALQPIVGVKITLTTHLAPDLGRIRADPAQVEQILMNLTRNARDAMPTGGKLDIETGNVVFDEKAARSLDTTPGRYVMLAVRDNGVGMDDATRARVFDPFFTTKAVSDVGKAAGLGLAAVHAIVQQSGGFIDVVSAVGAGASFRVYFPRLDDAATVRPGNPLPRREFRTVLVVEPEPRVLALTRTMLQRIGYAVLEADGGQRALDLAARSADLVDLLIAEADGVTSRVREVIDRLTKGNSDLKVIFLTNDPNPPTVDWGIPAASFVFVTKPFTPTMLSQAIHRLEGDSGDRERRQA